MDIKEYIDRDRFIYLLKNNLTQDNVKAFLEKRNTVAAELADKKYQERSECLKAFAENYNILAENVYFENISLEDAILLGVTSPSNYKHPQLDNHALKLKKLVELYNIKIYTGTRDFIAYKDKDNVDREFYRIAKDLNLLTHPLIKLGISGETYDSETIAFINGKKPRMLMDSDTLAKYSAAINGLPYEEMTSGMSEFESFLEAISLGTIHY